VAKKITRRIGSGLTDQHLEETWLTEEADAPAVLAFFWKSKDACSRQWAWHAPIIEGARRHWSAFKAEFRPIDPNDYKAFKEYNARFIERSSAAWYLREIDSTARAVEIATEDNRPWLAVARAMQLGELITELRLKFRWDEYAEWGEKRLLELRDNGQAKRKGRDREARRARFEQLVAEGVPKMKAYQQVADENGAKRSAIIKDLRKISPSLR
jgi:hypothetical protein